MNRFRRWLLRNPVAPQRVKPVRSTRLNAEQLEAREVPAAPIAANDFYELGRNGAVSGNVLGNDYDPNGGTLSANLLSGPLHGSLSLSPSGDFTYVPLPGYVGQDAALYDAVNSAGEMASASIQFYVQSIPHDPVVQNDFFYTAPNTPVSGNVLANDSDPSGDTLTAMVAGSPSGGGSLNFQPDGSFTFTPNGGNSSTIPYAVTNQSGGIAYGYLTIIVEPPPPTNRPPVAEGEYFYTTPGVPISGNVLANDSDPDGDPLTATLVGGSYTGVLTLDPEGSFTYRPGAEGVAWFAYSVSDGRGGSATTAAYISIEPAANQPPSAVADTLTTRFGTPGSVNVLANDSDPNGDSLTVFSYTQPANGSVVIDSSGLATYTPTAGFSGSDAFTYTVADSKGGTATGTVAVTVAPLPTVTVTSSGQASETGATGQLTFARTDAVGDLVVTFTAGGTAVPGSKNDYTLSAGTLVDAVGTITIPDGQSFVTVNLIAVDDPWFEPTEIATFDIASGSGYVAGGATAKMDILDDDAATSTVSLVPTHLNLDEGKSSTLTVSRSGGSSGSMAASVQLANNPAVAVRASLNSDYTLVDSAGNAVVVTSSKFPVAFADGQSEVTFTVTAKGDNRIEPDEGVRFQLLSGGTAFTIGNKTSDLTIRDATPQVSITPSGRDLTEGGSGSFTVSRTGSTAGALAVSVRVETNPAFPTRAGWNSDYTLSLADGTVLTVSGGAFTVTIPDGQDSVSFDLKAKSDGIIEATEGVRLRVATGSTYAASGSSTADVSIADATPQVSISPSTTEVAEGASGTLTLTRTGDTSSSLAVTLRAETNPSFPTRAAWNTDYTLYSLTLPDGTPVPLVGGAFTVTIPAGQSSLPLSVNGLPDNKTEVTEGVRFRVAGNTVYAANPGEATADIALLDRTPVVKISPNVLTIPEGSSGTFTVTWEGETSESSSDRVVTLQLATNPSVTGRATWNTDYTLQADGQTLAVSNGRFTVTIPSGSNSQTVSIAAKADARVEGPEGIRVQVAAGTVYAAGGTPLDAIIADDPPTVAVTASTNATEGGSPGTFTLTRSGGDLSQPLTAYFTLGGTASKVWDYKVSGATYVASRGQYRVTFPASSSGSPTSVVVTLPTVDGDCPELDETVELAVVSDSPRYVASASQGQRAFTIVDNDVTPDMVAPGKTWTDGSSVSVFNPGDTWIRASVVSPGWVRLSPVACGETGPATQNDYFAVVSGLNGFDGDATWVGDVGGLTLTASGDVFDVTIGGRVTLDAGESVGDVTAGTVVSVQAAESVSDVTAEYSVGSILAWTGIGNVWAKQGDVSGSVVSIAGSVGDVTAGTDITGSVTVGDDIGRVTAGRHMAGTLTAGRDITGVAAAGTAGSMTGDLSGAVTAGRSIGFVFASRDLTGDLTAENGNIGWVGDPVYGTWPDTDLTAVPSGGVSAGRNITSTIRASEGEIAPVFAGVLVDGPDEGWLAGDVIAGKGDLVVLASGDITGAISVADGNALVVVGGNLAGTVSALGGMASVETMGEVSATITGQLGVTVTAVGSIAGLLQAGDDDYFADVTVSSAASVTATITASYGVTVSASGLVSGPISGLSEVSVTADGDGTGTITSLAGGVEVRSGGSIRAAVTGAEYVLVVAAGDIAAPVTAGDVEDDRWGEADVSAGGDILGNISAVGGVRVTAGGSVSGNVMTVINEAIVSVGGNVSGNVTGDYAVVEAEDITGVITAALGIEARAHGVISGNLVSDGGDVWAQVSGAISGAVTAALEVYIEAGGNVSGAITAGAAGALANALIRSSGDVSGNVLATASSEVWAVGNISGDVLAGEGEAVALTLGSVQGIVHSDIGRIRVWAAGGTGRASSGSTGDLGPDWMVAVVNGEGSSLGGLLIVRGNGPEVVAAPNLDLPGSPDFLAADAAADELGGKPRTPRPPAAGTPAGMPVAAPVDWTPIEYLRRASMLSQWFQGMDPARAERWQQFTKNAPLGEIWDKLKRLMETIDITSLSPDFATLDETLDKLIGPEEAPPPRVAGPQAKPGPSPEDLKRWSNEVAEQLKASAAEADSKIQAANEDAKRRTEFWRNRVSVARQFEDEAPRHWIAGWEGTFRTKARDLRLEGDRALNSRDFDLPPNSGPIPRTEAGKAQAERDATEIALLRSIGDMPVTQKLGVALHRAMNAKNPDGSNKLGADLRAAIAEMVKPENLAIMGGIVGVAGVATFFGGPAVVTGISVIGYMFTGQSVLEIGEDIFKFVTTAAGARTSADFDRAADHLIKALTQGTTELVQNAAGATAAKVVARAAAAKVLAGDVAKGAVDAKAAAVQRADGRVEIKLPPEPPAPPVGGGPAAAAAAPLPILGVILRRWKGNIRPAPDDLSPNGKALWTDLYERFGPGVLEPVVRDAAGDAAKTERSLDDLNTIVNKLLQRTDWPQIHPKNPDRRLDTDDQIRKVLDRVLGNMEPGRPLGNATFDRPAFLRDLAEISDLKGFSTELGSLQRNQALIRGNVAEVQAAAADRRAGKIVEDIDTHVQVTQPDGTVVKTDIDLISDGALWQVKIGRSPKAIEDAAVDLGLWTEKAIAVAKSQGKTKVGFRFDTEAMKRYDHEAFQKKLAQLKKDNPGFTFVVETITPPNVP